ncbi:MAG TPA: serine protease, partial [Candidatus Coprenecus pullistercoris]|nr:serine protease [Candidatus Coprenecus pullistercoris]
PKKKSGWLYAGISVAVVCVAALVALGLYFMKRPMSDSEIISKYEKSVGLLAVEYHFEVNCGHLLFDKFVLGEDGIVEYDGENSMKSQGTGFFVGNSGAIVTNRHMARPWEAMDLDFGTAVLPIEEMAEICFREALTELYEDGCTEALPYISQVDVHGVVDNIVVIPNGKYVYNVINCAEVACSPKDEDLAVLKILTDQLPVNVTPVPLDKIVYVEPEKGAHVLTIGFPKGLDLQTDIEKKEIQAHTTSGSITRNDNKYLFGLDAVSSAGASGSPVFDEYGNLMGVLNSGYDTQGFNFGVRSEYVVALLKATGILE